MLIVLILSWLFAMPVLAQKADSNLSGSIEGTVLNEVGKPIAGATVFGLPENDMRHQIRTITDEFGHFRLSDIPLGNVYVDAYKESEGYTYNFFAFFSPTMPYRTILKVNIDKDNVLNVVVQVGPKAGFLNIDIADQDGRRLSSGVSLVFRRDDVPGDYAVGSPTSPFSMFVPPVPFRFEIRAEGYEPWQSGIVKPESGKNVEMAVRLKAIASGESPKQP